MKKHEIYCKNISYIRLTGVWAWLFYTNTIIWFIVVLLKIIILIIK